MPTFDFTFTVRAPLSAVADFHRDTRALARLTPPPVRVRLHRVEPLAEGSISEFSLWFAFLPIRWTARHSSVDPEHGFIDTQIAGPLEHWVHTHTFSDEAGSQGSGDLSRITEHIEYRHYPGARGLLSRLLFAPLGLRLMFCYRRQVTRRLLEKPHATPRRAGEEHV